MTEFFNKLGRKNGNTNEAVQVSNSKSTPRQTTKSLNRIKTVKGQTNTGILCKSTFIHFYYLC